MNAEGWYRDPYGRHTDRWMSDGRPTKLVRDDGVVSHDEPPGDLPATPLVEADEKPARPHDMLRADGEASDEFNMSDPAQAVFDHGIVGPEF